MSTGIRTHSNEIGRLTFNPLNHRAVIATVHLYIFALVKLLLGIGAFSIILLIRILLVTALSVVSSVRLIEAVFVYPSLNQECMCAVLIVLLADDIELGKFSPS